MPIKSKENVCQDENKVAARMKSKIAAQKKQDGCHEEQYGCPEENKMAAKEKTRWLPRKRKNNGCP